MVFPSRVLSHFYEWPTYFSVKKNKSKMAGFVSQTLQYVFVTNQLLQGFLPYGSSWNCQKLYWIVAWGTSFSLLLYIFSWFFHVHRQEQKAKTAVKCRLLDTTFSHIYASKIYLVREWKLTSLNKSPYLECLKSPLFQADLGDDSCPTF